MFQPGSKQDSKADKVQPSAEPISLAFSFAGECFWATGSGALFHPERSLLMVADLHLEKGSSFARSGQFLPPYDSRVTLEQLARDIDHFQPKQVICLGDSFHDVDGPSRLEDQVRSRLNCLVKRQTWIWVIGNHDPHLPDTLGGEVVTTQSLSVEGGNISLCHEPGISTDHQGHAFEICGHLHPVATIPSRGRSLRCRCFLVNPQQIIMPAYGAYTGGLNVRDEAYQAFVSKESRVLAIGRQTISAVPLKHTKPHRRR